MISQRLDIKIEQGSTFYMTVNAKNADGTIKNLSGFTGKMQIRPTVSSSTIYVEASTTNGMISITPALGQVVVTLSGATTSLFDWSGGVYDLKVENGTEAYRLVYGDVALSKQVTR